MQKYAAVKDEQFYDPWMSIADIREYTGRPAANTVREWYKLGLRSIKVNGLRRTKRSWLDEFLHEFEVK